MKVFRDLILVKRLDNKQDLGGIVLDKVSSLVRLEVLAIGPDVKEDLKVGDVVLAEDLIEILNKTKPDIGVMLSKYIAYAE